MNKIAVVLFILTAAIGVPHTALAQMNAVNMLPANAAGRLENCNNMSYLAYEAKGMGIPVDAVEKMFVLVDGCIATAKQDTNRDYQAALNLVKNNPIYVAKVNSYHTYWLSIIGNKGTKDDQTLSQLKQLAAPLSFFR